MRSTLARASASLRLVALGDARDAQLERRDHPHAQRRLGVEQEVRAAAHDDALAVAPERQHDVGQVAQVVRRREHAALDEARDPLRDAVLHPLVERFDHLLANVGLVGDVVDQLVRIETKPEPLRDQAAHGRAARAVLARDADRRPLDVALDPFPLPDPAFLLPEQDLLVHEVIDAADHGPPPGRRGEERTDAIEQS